MASLYSHFVMAVRTRAYARAADIRDYLPPLLYLLPCFHNVARIVSVKRIAVEPMRNLNNVAVAA